MASDEHDFDVVIHENYGLSIASELGEGSQNPSKAPRVDSLASLLAFALGRGIPILNESANLQHGRVEVATGASFNIKTFKISRDLDYFGVSRSDSKKQTVISKHLSKAPVDDENQRYDALVRELLILSHPPLANHANIINFIALGWEDTPDNNADILWPTAVLEYADYGSLHDFFGFTDVASSWELNCSLCSDIADALRWLHGCRIVHSDVKMENILVTRNSEPDTPARYRAKLCDFGFAIDVDALENIGQRGAKLDGYPQFPWHAPESGTRIELHFLPRVDVYCFGLLACRIFLNGASPFDSRFCSSQTMQTLPCYDLLSDWLQEDNLVDHLCRSCRTVGLYDEEQLHFIRGLFGMSTRMQAENRSDMANICNIFDTGNGNMQPYPLSYESKGGWADIVPDLEECWVLSLPITVQQTVINDLERLVRLGDSHLSHGEEDEQSGDAAYQLFLAYEIGFGGTVSTGRSLEYLLLSCRFGNPNARRDIFGLYSAFSCDFPSQYLPDLRRWLYEAALSGDKVCLEELEIVDTALFAELVKSDERGRHLCQRCGITFDDSFFSTNDLSDVPGLISAIQSSGDPINTDIGGGMSWLHYAAYSGSLEMVVQLVDTLQAPIDVGNDLGQTPLWIACLGGYYNIAEFLLERNADASLPCHTSGLTPLHHLPAFDDGKVLKIAQRLAKGGNNVNAQAQNGMTPLHYAIRGSSILRSEATVGTLLTLGANPLVADEDGETSIHAAIFTMRDQYLDSLLASEHVLALTKNELSALLANAFGDFVRQLRYHRLRQGSSEYRQKLARIVQLLRTEDIVCQYITAHPLGYTPLHDAYVWGSIDIANEMLHQGVTFVNTVPTKGIGYPPLMAAVRYCREWDDIERLLQAGADPMLCSRSGENVLHISTEYNARFLPFVSESIERRGGNLTGMLNASTLSAGLTPFDYSILTGSFSASTFLLAKGTDPATYHIGDGDDKFNSLSSSLAPLNIKALNLLLDLPNPQNFIISNGGWTLLHCACARIPDEAKVGDYSAASFIIAILDRFPDTINSTAGTFEHTPLHISTFLGNVTAAKILYSRGADVKRENACQETPLDMVRSRRTIVLEGKIGLERRALKIRFREMEECLTQWSA